MNDTKIGSVKKKIDTLDLKLKTFLCLRNCQENEKTSHRCKEIFANHVSDKGCLSRIYIKKKNYESSANHPITKCAKNLNRIFNEEDIRMANKHMKRCSTSSAVK